MFEIWSAVTGDFGTAVTGFVTGNGFAIPGLPVTVTTFDASIGAVFRTVSDGDGVCETDQNHASAVLDASVHHVFAAFDTTSIWFWEYQRALSHAIASGVSAIKERY